MFRLLHVRAKQSDIHRPIAAVQFRLERFRRLNYVRSLSITKNEARKQLDDQQTELSQQAKTLTLSLYRTVMRSVRLLGQCNEHDEQEFKAREEKRERDLHVRSTDSRLEMISMLPAVDPEEELKSRVSYYKQYARENFSQESDCLDHERWEEDHIARYIYLLKRGEKHRKWLLLDMKFKDPYSDLFDVKLVERFEKAAIDFANQASEVEGKSKVSSHLLQAKLAAMTGQSSNKEDDDVWSTDDEDETSSVPDWYKNPRSE